MNSNWQDFLTSQTATFLNNGDIQFSKTPTSLISALFPVPQLTVIKVTGNDALIFLQGQLSCNVKELNCENSFFTAFCNAKGRTISTILIFFKQENNFFLILPSVLADKVQKKLQMYILRSDVHLHNLSDEFCIIGLSCSSTHLNNEILPNNDFGRRNAIIKLSQSRYLIIATVENSIKQWSKWLNDGFIPQNSCLWNYLDISTGLAWLDTQSSEHYIPQMLNLDKLGGISFDKGCYTGQEVIARTHYLGSSKRALFVGECAADTFFKDNRINNLAGESIGKIIQAEKFGDKQTLLIVMSTIANDDANLQFEQHLKIIKL